MKQYKSFVRQLETLFNCAKYNPNVFQDEIEAATNGLAKSELYLRVPVAIRRKTGTFFTDEHTARIAARFLQSKIEAGGIICDPACGAGDLLLACTDYLPIERNYRQTLSSWEKQLFGYDLQENFVQASRLRLALKCLVKSRSKIKAGHTLENFFTKITTRDGLIQNSELSRVDGVIMNPPFCLWNVSNLDWTSGSVNSSAVFVTTILQQLTAGARLVAILPDVLRSGSRYSKWRKKITESSCVENVVQRMIFLRKRQFYQKEIMVR